MRNLDNTQAVILDDYAESFFTGSVLAKLRGKKVLITGVTGMLASYIVDVLLIYNDRLMNNGDRICITGMARDKDRVARRFANWRDRKDLNFIIQDVVEPLATSETFDYIIHAASNASPKFYKTDPVGTLMANIEGTRNLLSYAQNHKIESFLFFSSGEVYGNPTGRNYKFNEDSFGALNPVELRSCYAEGKRAGEAMCVAWCSQYGIPVKIVRPFHVYGPGMKLDDGRVFADFVSDIVHKRDIIIRSDGLARRAFCYISDATQAFLKVLLFGENGVPYNIGNPEAEISIGELATMLINLYPELSLKVRYDYPKENYMPSDTIAVVPDIQRIKQMGWEPTVSIKTGFQKTIRSFQR